MVIVMIIVMVMVIAMLSKKYSINPMLMKHKFSKVTWDEIPNDGKLVKQTTNI